jgi:hypothetical protein
VSAVAADLEACQIYYKEPCILVAVDDAIAADVRTPSDMPRLSYSGLFDPAQIPTIDDLVRKRTDIASYRSQKLPKAVALHPWGRIFIAVGTDGQRQAEELALKQCNDDPTRKRVNGPCFLYAAGDSVILPQRATSPVAK